MGCLLQDVCRQEAGAMPVADAGQVQAMIASIAQLTAAVRTLEELIALCAADYRSRADQARPPAFGRASVCTFQPVCIATTRLRRAYCDDAEAPRCLLRRCVNGGWGSLH